MIKNRLQSLVPLQPVSVLRVLVLLLLAGLLVHLLVAGVLVKVGLHHPGRPPGAPRSRVCILGRNEMSVSDYDDWIL